MKSETYENKMAAVVGRYATPLAILVIAAGIFLAQPPGRGRKAATLLMVFGILFNIGMLRMIKREAAGRSVVMARLFANVFLNTFIFYLLAPYWPPIWLLLALSPLAAAIYSSRQDTLKAAGVVTVTMLIVHNLRGGSSDASWGQQAVQCAFVVLISLLVNDLAVLAREGFEGRSQAG